MNDDSKPSRPKIVDLSERLKESKPPSPINALKKYIADVEAGQEPAPKRIVLVTASDEDYQLYTAGANELEEIGLAGLGLHMLVGVATGGGE